MKNLKPFLNGIMILITVSAIFYLSYIFLKTPIKYFDDTETLLGAISITVICIFLYIKFKKIL